MYMLFLLNFPAEHVSVKTDWYSDWLYNSWTAHHHKRGLIDGIYTFDHPCFIQSTLVISTSIIWNNHLSRRESGPCLNIENLQQVTKYCG